MRGRELGLVCFGVLIGASSVVLLTEKPLGVRGPYYARCRDAIQAGVAPIYYGAPGYRLALDADGDGVACEPYRR